VVLQRIEIESVEIKSVEINTEHPIELEANDSLPAIVQPQDMF
jgi:hypothetical protein